MNENEIYDKLRADPYYIKEIEQTPERCKFALSINANVLQYIHNQTEELCLFALGQNYRSFQYIRNKTNKIIKRMLDYDSTLICYVDDPSEEISKYAASVNQNAFRYIPNQTLGVFKDALKRNRGALYHLREQLPEFVDYAISYYWGNIAYVDNPTMELKKKAFEYSCNAASYFGNYMDDEVYNYIRTTQSDGLIYIKNNQIEIINTACTTHDGLHHFFNGNMKEVIKIALKINGEFIAYVEQTEENWRIAIKSKPASLRYVRNHTEEMCMYAVGYDPDVLQYARVRTFNVHKKALEKKGAVIAYIPYSTIEEQKIALDNDYSVFPLIRNKSVEIIKYGLQKNGINLCYLHNPSDEYIAIALQSNPEARYFIPNFIKYISRRMMKIITHDDVCSICLDCIENNENASRSRLACNHDFHTQCIINTLTTSNSIICPICCTFIITDKIFIDQEEIKKEEDPDNGTNDDLIFGKHFLDMFSEISIS